MFHSRRTSAGLIAASMTALLAFSVCAQDLPKRRPGLWEMTMEGLGPASGMTSQQCVDAASDAAMQKRAMSGEPGSECSRMAPKPVAGGVEVEADCVHKDGKSHIKARITGDMQSAYTVDSNVTFDPPRQGVGNAHMLVKARHAGACPAGMKPGDIRVGGMQINPGAAAAPGKPGGMPMGIDPSQLQNMTPAQRQQLMEQLKKLRPATP